MIRPSKNFAASEWSVSRDHPHLITPPEKFDLAVTINCMRLTLGFMQPSRDLVGALQSLSWFRSQALNSAIPGDPDSSHLTGLACDFLPLAIPTQRLLHLALTGELATVGAEWDKLNFYSHENYYHVSLRPVLNGPSRQRIYRDWNRVV